ncbi:hypothetical protein NDU88_005390 [Pleurodeles waltl]|uniref:Uncharacterized protein n=1 Tax=Pleurodeles waltl TaxID=8319 RepID=A0AAV7TC38_PLEWA|nr:hypothetical protein NDU88_005390 [Pleurodeles waltl]
MCSNSLAARSGGGGARLLATWPAPREALLGVGPYPNIYPVRAGFFLASLAGRPCGTLVPRPLQWRFGRGFELVDTRGGGGGPGPRWTGGAEDVPQQPFPTGLNFLVRRAASLLWLRAGSFSRRIGSAVRSDRGPRDSRRPLPLRLPGLVLVAPQLLWTGRPRGALRPIAACWACRPCGGADWLDPAWGADVDVLQGAAADIAPLCPAELGGSSRGAAGWICVPLLKLLARGSV